jgi:hypothetical protein
MSTVGWAVVVREDGQTNLLNPAIGRLSLTSRQKQQPGRSTATCRAFSGEWRERDHVHVTVRVFQE